MSSRGRHQKLQARQRRKRAYGHACQEWGNAFADASERYQVAEQVVMAALMERGSLADGVRALHAHMDAQ